MDKATIEKEVRGLQVEVWNARGIRYRMSGVPDIPTIFDPRNVADHCGLFYEERTQLETDYLGGKGAAGLWQRGRSTILVSTRYSYEVRRFTAAHEIGHFLLHPDIGHRTLHRELPLDGSHSYRSQIEREADHAAACLLMPSGAVRTMFAARFGAKHPVALTETVAFHLGIDYGQAFSQPRGSLLFAQAVARAEKFGGPPFKSLAQFFGVSAKAMAIRVEELGLVTAYLPAEHSMYAGS
jgi:Zn-dependent peptidase ImmA (M78 family)